MWTVLWTNKFSGVAKPRLKNPENTNFTLLWKNIVMLKSWSGPKSSFTENIIEKIVWVMGWVVNDFAQNIETSWNNYKKLSDEEEWVFSKEMTAIFNEMLLNALLLSEDLSAKSQEKNIEMNNELKLLHIENILVTYKAKIAVLLNNKFI